MDTDSLVGGQADKYSGLIFQIWQAILRSKMEPMRSCSGGGYSSSCDIGNYPSGGSWFGTEEE